MIGILLTLLKQQFLEKPKTTVLVLWVADCRRADPYTYTWHLGSTVFQDASRFGKRGAWKTVHCTPKMQ